MFYAIGDIHGEITLLKELYQKIQDHISMTDDPFGNTIVFLGDYIDRGEDNKGVMDFLMSLKDTDNTKHIFLKGNHEDLLIYARDGENIGSCQLWLQNGGHKTLKDFGITIDDVFEGALDEYIKWINDNCVNYHETVDYVFCHGGLDIREPLSETKEEVFLWKRTYNLGSYKDYGKIVVHGHTPLEDGLILQGQKEINVDTGSFFTKVLTAVILPHINESDGMTLTFPTLSVKGKDSYI